MFTRKHTILALVIVLLLAGGFFLFNPKKAIGPSDIATTTEGVVDLTGSPNVPASASNANAPLPIVGKSAPAGGTSVPQTGKLYKEFVRPTGFSNTGLLGLLNTDAFTLKQFVGQKVILLNFWTTSASNALRVFPYLNAWHTKYKDEGLLIVSIHVPRFMFEQSKSVVDATVFAAHVLHPVVLDNNYETWRAYGNTVWPHQYLIDINGRIAYDHPGEGAYGTTELKIQELLALRAQKLGLPKETYAPPATPKDAVVIDFSRPRSPETYFGSARNATLGNGVPMREGTQDLEYPATVISGVPYLSGSWSFTKEYAMNLVANAGVRYAYSAQIVQAVLNVQKLTRIKVLRDGVALTPENAGKDILFEKGESYFYVSGVRIYDIVNDKAGYGPHRLELIIESPGLEVYTITFG